jgi:hypothetical protein
MTFARLRFALVLVVVPVSVLALAPSASGSTTYGANWQMNEINGPMRDSSGNNNNSQTIEPGVTRDGTYYHFNRGRVIVPSSPSDTPGLRDFTLTARIHLNTIADENYVQKGVHSLVGQQIKIENSGNHLHCRVRGSLGEASVWGFGKAPVLLNGYHTFACRKTSSAVQILLDGHLIHQVKIDVGNLTTSSVWSFGGKDPCLHPNAPPGSSVGCDFLQGSMDYVTLSYP